MCDLRGESDTEVEHGRVLHVRSPPSGRVLRSRGTYVRGLLVSGGGHVRGKMGRDSGCYFNLTPFQTRVGIPPTRTRPFVAPNRRVM